MYINAKAQGHKRHFNVISKKVFEKILAENSNMSRELLRCSFYPYEEQLLEEIENEVERTIKYSINLISDNPKEKSIILTSDEQKEIYLQSEHYKNSKDVSIKSGTEALELIEEFWKLCTYK